MRKATVLLFACALGLALIPPASSQARIDIGGILTKEIDITTKDKTRKNLDGFLDELPVLPLPELGLSYQWGIGPARLGIGARAFSLIAESMAWPQAGARSISGGRRSRPG